MSIETEEFRRVLGHFASGVTVVTAMDPATRQPAGLTVSAFASLSLEPTLVLVCIEKDADTHDPIARAGYFAVNVLDVNGEALSRRFATSDGAAKFNGIPYRTDITGAPLLDDALAWLECTLRASHDGGDHTIYVGEVVAADAREGEPLIFYRGGYGRSTAAQGG